MATDNKVRNATNDALGHAKEAAGNVTNDPNLKAEGKADQSKAKLGKAAENVKDAVRR